MTEMLVHIGYPKSASSWLQSGLFSGQAPGFVPLGAGAVGHNQPYTKGGEAAFFDSADPLVRGFSPFAFSPEAARDWITAQTPPLAKGQMAVLTNEAWTGHPFSGGITATTIAGRIHATLPEARILIVVREQRAMLLSAYAHFLTKACGLVGMARYLAPVLGTQIPGHDPAFYRFSGIVEHYQTLFGADRVLVLPMEALAQDAAAFQAAICSFAGVDAGHETVLPSKSNSRDWADFAALRHARWINMFGRPTPANGHIGLGWMRLRGALIRALKLLDRGMGRAKRRLQTLRQADMNRIDAHLREAGIAADNARLQTLIDRQTDVGLLLDLASFGYVVDPSSHRQEAARP